MATVRASIGGMPHASLTDTIRRLEAATSRLEDIASSSPGPAPSVNGVPPDALANVVAAGASSAVPEPAPQPLPPAIEDFDVLINQDVKDFVRLSDELGGLVSEQVCALWTPQLKDWDGRRAH